MARALIATDGSEIAITAARRAVALLSSDTDYTVMAVIRPPSLVTGSDGGIAAIDLALVSEAEGLAEEEGRAEVSATTAVLGVPAKERVVHGDPGTTICQVAENEGFDLIVMGAHGSGVVKRVLLGSVSHYVLHHAPCPVLVVRKRAPDGD